MKHFFLITLCLIFCITVSAQNKKKSKKNILEISQAVQKKPLTHDVYDAWKEIPDKMLSTDGSMVIYTLNPQEGDGKIIFHS